MDNSLRILKRYLAVLVLLVVFEGLAIGQDDPIVAVRIDGRPDTPEFDPIIDESTFAAVGAESGDNGGGNFPGNINGPSVIRVPDWIPASERVNPAANYYMYFAHHVGFNIRLAWAESLTGEWTLFNTGNAPDRAWGVNGNNTGTQTPRSGVLSLSSGNTGNNRVESNGGNNLIAANGHIASPDVHVDDVNQRILMYFHAPYTEIAGQNTFLATSQYGLNFNATHQGGESGTDLGGNEFGVRSVVPGGGYVRTFIVSGQTFAFSNLNELWKAPGFNDAGQLNTHTNADTEGGLWNPSAGFDAVGQNWWDSPGLTATNQSANPLRDFYALIGEGAMDVRHTAVYTRTHIDPTDTNVYLFYSARNDAPESIILSIIDTDNGSTDTLDWEVLGQQIMLEPELDWEGINNPLEPSLNGAQIGVRQLRDPYVFEDDDGELYLFYSGAGEEAIGFARLEGDVFDGGGVPEPPQITLFAPTGSEPEPTEDVIFDGVMENGQTVATIINAAGTPGARGGFFVIGDPGMPMSITGITFQGNQAQNFADGDEMTAVIFTGNDFDGVSATNITPAGLAEAPGISVLYEETFPLPPGVPASNFLVVDFSDSLVVDSGDQLGVMVFTNTEFSQLEGQNNGGGRLLYRANEGVAGPSGSRDFRFSILGFKGEEVLVGDVNCDGVINLLDVGPFVDLITSGEFNDKGDINGDEFVNLLDVGPFVALLTGG